jgi:hypothetical protein
MYMHRRFPNTPRAPRARLLACVLLGLASIGLLPGNSGATARGMNNGVSTREMYRGTAVRVMGATPATLTISETTARTAGTRCTPRGHVYLHSLQVTIWSTAGTKQLYACLNASGSVHRLASADSNSSLEDFLAAGHFVSFVQVEGAFYHLDVFDALNGRAVLKRDLGCSGPDGCEGAGVSFQLSSEGWVALIGQPLRATNGHEETIEMDTGPNLEAKHLKSWSTTGVSVEQSTGSTLQWSPDDGASVYSLPLGSSLQALSTKGLQAGTVRPVNPLAAPCSLFAAAEAQAVLGPGSQTAQGDTCTYTTSSKPSSTLTLTLHPGLTPAQVSAAETLAFSEAARATPGANTGAPAYNPHLWKAAWDTASGGVSKTTDVRILTGLSLTVELASNSSSNHTDVQVGPSQLWDSDTAAAHVADIAFDRVAGVPISHVG